MHAEELLNAWTQIPGMFVAARFLTSADAADLEANAASCWAFLLVCCVSCVYHSYLSVYGHEGTHAARLLNADLQSQLVCSAASCDATTRPAIHLAILLNWWATRDGAVLRRGVPVESYALVAVSEVLTTLPYGGATRILIVGFALFCAGKALSVAAGARRRPLRWASAACHGAFHLAIPCVMVEIWRHRRLLHLR